MQENTIGHARIVTRRSPCFPFRKQRCLDFTPWNGGYVHYSGGPGAIVLDMNAGILADLRTGRVYHDARFTEGGGRA